MNLTPKEQQEALILWGREAFGKRMGIGPAAVVELCRKNDLLPPTEQLRRKMANDKDQLIKDVLRAVDLEPAATMLGVSKATLKTILSENGYPNGAVKAEELDKAKVWDTAQRTGSVSLTARLYNTTTSALKKLGLDRTTISDPAKHGFRARTGRIGERAAKAALIETGYREVIDCNEQSGFNTPGVDLKYTNDFQEDPKSQVGHLTRESFAEACRLVGKDPDPVISDSTDYFKALEGAKLKRICRHCGLPYGRHYLRDTCGAVCIHARVSVKTTHPYRTRNSKAVGWTWSFAWPKTEDSDDILLVALDRMDYPVAIAKRKRPLTVVQMAEQAGAPGATIGKFEVPTETTVIKDGQATTTKDDYCGLDTKGQAWSYTVRVLDSDKRHGTPQSVLQRKLEETGWQVLRLTEAVDTTQEFLQAEATSKLPVPCPEHREASLPDDTLDEVPTVNDTLTEVAAWSDRTVDRAY